MTVPLRLQRVLPYLLLALFCVVSVRLRPLLPVDETRYLSVAWEMYLRQSFFVPTLNFAPYFHKPPLLFWLIDLAWIMFGVSRTAAVGVIFAISSSVIYLTQRLAKSLFPHIEGMAERMPWLMLGSAVFMIYSTLILFDLLLTACVLAATLFLLAFSKTGWLRHAALTGLCIGVGILAKGPVMLIHMACPILLFPLWRDPTSNIPVRTYWLGLPLVLLTSIVPVAAWLGPAFAQTGLDFAYDLVWRQAAGRISGSMEGAHARPIYFYLLILPVALIPWIFSADVWRSKPWNRIFQGSDIETRDRKILLSLGLWCCVTLVIFSLISGKQPHYLVPLLPVLMILFGYIMACVRFSVFPFTAALMVAIFGIGQAIASLSVFNRYDLHGLGDFIAGKNNAEWAFAGHYQGEVTFLARLQRQVEVVDKADANSWLEHHRNGYLIMRMRTLPMRTQRVAFSQRVERGYLVVFSGASLQMQQ